jgi:hypothetical protein
MKKQTAVEWLMKQMSLGDRMHLAENGVDFEKGKAMERQQTVDAYCECWMMDGGNGDHKLKEANEYYNKTFGGEE